MGSGTAFEGGSTGRPLAVSAWLTAGALGVGFGAAVLGGTAVAHADAGDPGVARTAEAGARKESTNRSRPPRDAGRPLASPAQTTRTARTARTQTPRSAAATTANRRPAESVTVPSTVTFAPPSPTQLLAAGTVRRPEAAAA